MRCTWTLSFALCLLGIAHSAKSADKRIRLAQDQSGPTLPPVLVTPPRDSNTGPATAAPDFLDPGPSIPSRSPSALDGSALGGSDAFPRDGSASDGFNGLGEDASGTYDAYGNPGLSWSSGLIESDQQLVGPYAQPVWTTQRPFATTRAYVLPAGTAQVEQWVRPTWKRGDKTEYRFLEELAVGLPGRFQLDIYERWNSEPDANGNNVANHEGVQLELRWAVADWGVLPLNPTFYIEWVERGGPQEKPNKYEAKLLLADNLTENIYYSSNVILEQETSGERETEIGWSHALATTVIDRRLLAGIEAVWSGTNVHDNRSHYDIAFLIGPSLQFRPTNRTFVDVVGLFGTTDESPRAQMYIIAGFQFGTRGAPVGFAGPAATRGN